MTSRIPNQTRRLPVPDADTSALSEQLDTLCSQFSGRIGYSFTNLNTSEHLTRNEAMEFPTASTIKLPVLTALHAHAERTGFDWNEPVPVDTVEVAPGSGILQYLSRDLRLSYRDLAWLMICLSDNTATNLVIGALGRERAAALIADLIDPAIRLRGGAGASFDTSYPSMGYATPGAMGRYLDRLAAGDLPGASQTIAVARQQVFQSMVPRYLPQSATAEVPLNIAHKTGALPGVRSDIAIISTTDATITAALFTADCDDRGYDTIHEGELCIAALTYAVCRAWLGVSSDVGDAALGER
jgi:beta-lactamase class A